MKKKIEKPTIIVDTRERKPYKFQKTDKCNGYIVEKLDQGDYALQEYPNLIVIERKKDIDELCSCIGIHRDRFEKELERMQQIRYKYVVVEDYYSSIYNKRSRFSKMNSNAIFESIIALEVLYNVHFIFAGNRQMAQSITRSLLLRAFKYKKEDLI